MFRNPKIIFALVTVGYFSCDLHRKSSANDTFIQVFENIFEAGKDTVSAFFGTLMGTRKVVHGIAEVVSRVDDNIDSIITKVEKIGDKVEEVAEKIVEKIGNIKEAEVQKIKSWLERLEDLPWQQIGKTTTAIACCTHAYKFANRYNEESSDKGKIYAIQQVLSMGGIITSAGSTLFTENATLIIKSISGVQLTTGEILAGQIAISTLLEGANTALDYVDKKQR
jgi:hypothetical protein